MRILRYLFGNISRFEIFSCFLYQIALIFYVFYKIRKIFLNKALYKGKIKHRIIFK